MDRYRSPVFDKDIGRFPGDFLENFWGFTGDRIWFKQDLQVIESGLNRIYR